VDVDRAVLELYGLAPEEFTAARNAVVKAAKDAGERAGSESLKALRNPTLAAWLANQLVRTDPRPGQRSDRARRPTARGAPVR
jgi:hypothetical protein